MQGRQPPPGTVDERQLLAAVQPQPANEDRPIGAGGGMAAAELVAGARDQSGAAHRLRRRYAVHCGKPVGISRIWLLPSADDAVGLAERDRQA